MQYFASDVPRPIRLDYLDLKQETVRKMLKEYKDYVSKLKLARQQGLKLREVTMAELLSEEKRTSLAARSCARRDMTEDIVREVPKWIAGTFRSIHEVDVDQPTRDMNRLLRLGPVSAIDRAMVAVQRVKGFLGKNELTHIFVSNSRWEAG